MSNYYDGRKNDLFKSELKTKLSRIDVDVYSADRQYNFIGVRLRSRPQIYYTGFNSIEITGPDLEINADSYDDGEYYGNIDVERWAEDLAEEMDDSLVSQVKDVLYSMRSEYRDFDDDFRVTIRRGTTYSIRKKYNIRRSSY